MERQDGEKTAPALQVIEAFGGIRPMAQKLGVAASTVQGWKEREAIPENRHDRIREVLRAEAISLDDEILAASAHAPAGEDGSEETGAAAQAEPATEGLASVAWSGPDAEPAAKSEAAAESGAASEAARPTTPGRGLGAFLAGALVLALGAGLAVATSNLWRPVENGGSGSSAALAKLEARIADLEAKPAVDPRMADLEGRVAAAEAASRDAERRAESALALSGGGVSEDALAALEQRLSAQLATRLDEVAARLERVESHQVVRPVSSADLVLTLSLGRLREALLTGEAFADVLAAARQAAAGRPAVGQELAGLEPFAADGVPRLLALEQAFQESARDIVAASAGEGEEDSLLAGIKRRIAKVVTVRPLSEEAEGPGTAARVARAEQALAQGDLTSALSEVEALEGPAAEAAAPWLQDARTRLSAERRLAEATEAFLGELAAPAAPE